MKKRRVLILCLVLCLAAGVLICYTQYQSHRKTEDTNNSMDISNENGSDLLNDQGIEIDEGDMQDPFSE